MKDQANTLDATPSASAATPKNTGCFTTGAAASEPIHLAPQQQPSSDGTDQTNNNVFSDSTDGAKMIHTDGAIPLEYCNTEILDPFESQIFGTETDAFQFYNMYALRKGFGIRIRKHVKNVGGNITYVEFVCSCEGKPTIGVQKSVKTGCKAMMRVRRCAENQWMVSKFEDVHNHALSRTLGMARHWGSHNNIDEGTRSVMKHLMENHINTTQMYGYISGLHGGASMLPFTRKYFEGVKRSIRKDESIDDVKKTLQFFSDLQRSSQNFFYAVDVGSDGKINNIFWSHAWSRLSYEHFGDVVTFDTTYQTNTYGMPFAPFVGVNNHFQTVIFGCALIREETDVAFKWLFRTFLQAVNEKHPIGILTDQSKAMENAIADVFPNTVHRWCKWHVLRKAKQHLGTIYSNRSSFKDKFHRVLNHTMTIDEFERGWLFLLNEYDLHNNTYLQKVWDDRIRWASPYFKDFFFAKMSTTQRSESMNHVLKRYVSPSSTMYNFVLQYEKFIADRIAAEDKQEFNTSQNNRCTRSGSPIEKKASSIYTNTIFEKFSDQVYMSASYIIKEIRVDGTYVTVHVDSETRDSWSNLSFEVYANKECSEYKCVCKLFEHMGILCCHIIKVMSHVGCISIPNKYILKRWTVHAREGTGSHLETFINDNDAAVSRTHRHTILFNACMDLSTKGDVSIDAFHIAMRHITQAKQEIQMAHTHENEELPTHTHGMKEIVHSDEVTVSNDDHSSNQEDESINQAEESISILPPDHRKKRGRPKSTRYKSQLDGPISKKRMCSHCNKKGHYRTSCPYNPENSSKSKIQKVCQKCKLPGHYASTCVTIG